MDFQDRSPETAIVSFSKMNRILESHTIRARPLMRDIQTATSSAKDIRIPALDFTKGTLVLFMVLYHWINYFIGIQWPYYRYLRFLTPSFIFISGFMISNVYLSKYNVRDSTLVKRLFTRAFKLIATFIVLNVLRNFVVPILSAGGVVQNLLDTKHLIAIFVTGTFTGKVVAFYVLVPIAYLLALSGILMMPLRRFGYVFHLVCAGLLVSIAALSASGMKNYNLEMVAIGAIGILSGFSPIAVVNRAVRHAYMIIVLYVLYTIAITIWNVPYPLEVVGTLVSVTAIYMVGTTSSTANRVRDEVILLGKYSLFGYISQIVVLQMLAVSLRHLTYGNTAAVISFFASFALTVIAVEVIHRARRRTAIDRLYRAVFS